MTEAATTCPYCGVGCGLLVSARQDGAVAVRGDPDHPANLGRLCSKGAALGDTLSLDGRLPHPMIAGARVTWDTALDHVAERFRETIAEHGPDSVAFYVSGQLLTEDYYVANKLMKGFIGSANIDTNSRLCMASSVAGHKRAFGSDTVPGVYEDIEFADLVVLVGSNLAWCHPVLFQRLAAARESRGTKIVVIDPRRTATCEIADLHLPIKPGADVALFNGLLTHLAAASAVDHDWVGRHVNGFAEALGAASTGDIGCDPEPFYELFARTPRVVTIYSQGVNQAVDGTDKVNAIINCHLATGRIGQPGMGPFSITGQPNAMGGRETGGLATMLAAHMDLDNPAHRALLRAFWGCWEVPAKPGLKAVDLFRAVGDGRVQAIWIMATNPVDSMPDADAVRAALAGCPFVVVSDVARRTDTTAMAHVLLPSLAWGEKDGTVTNSERRISRQRAFLPPPGEARADWWQLAEVARRMGFGHAFAWDHQAAIFAEYAALTGLENNGSRDLDISDHATIDREAYDAMTPHHWPCPAGGGAARTRFFADGRFFTPDGKARMVPTPACTANIAGFTLNTGRIRDQWHTMTRSAKAPRLMRHIGEPFVEIHPHDAARAGLADASIARVSGEHGTALLRVLVTDHQRSGSLFAPMHWTDQFTGAGRVDALIAAATDPISGQPALKSGQVSITPFPAAWHGFAVLRERPSRIDAEYWALAPTEAGWQLELAGGDLAGAETLRRTLFPGSETNTLAYHDRAAGRFRCATFEDDHLLGALFIAAEPVAVARSWLAEQLATRFDDPADRLRLLAGRPGAATPDRGAIVCACLEVGVNDILTAARSGQATLAGTNCGSCRMEVGRIINADRLAQTG